MSNYDDEEKLMEQENKGQGIDPIGVAQDAMEINNRIQQSRMKNDGNVDVAPKATKAASDAASTTSAGGANAAGGTAAKTAANAATTSGASATGAAAAGTAGTTAAATATVGTTTAASSTGLAALMANPYFWAVVGGIILIIIIAASLLLIFEPANAFGEGTAADENVMIGECEEGDTACEELVAELNENPDLGDYGFYTNLLAYCEKKTSLGDKFMNFLNKLIGRDEIIKNGCDLARVIESYSVAKEKEMAQNGSNTKLSRGLIVGTLQYLYEGVGKMEDKSNIEIEEAIVDASSANNVLENVAASGMVTALDIKALVEYMVYNMDYTLYNWEVTDIDDEYMCKYDPAPYDCKTLITYGCVANNFKDSYPDINKYFLFLRFGGSYRDIYDGSLERNKYIWNKVSVEDGKLVIHKQDFDILLGDKLNNEQEILMDPATSFQEITSYNMAYGATADECKIEGKAAESLPADSGDTFYKTDEGSVKKAITAMPYEPIDTNAYDIDPKSITEARTANVLGFDCKLNNIKSKEEVCEIQEKDLTYFEGFMYGNFPQYKYTNDENGVSKEEITGELYTSLGESIEGTIEIIDEYEDELNEMFGLDNFIYDDINFYTGVGSTSLCAYQNKNVRLVDPKSGDGLPGGSTYVNGTYVANNSISFEEYIKGAVYGEIGKYIRSENLEYLKFQILVIKSFTLNEANEVNGELYIRRNVVQAYKDVSSLASRYKTVLDQAYNEVKDDLLYKSGTEKIFNAFYGQEFQDGVLAASKGLSYTEILNTSFVRDYGKAPYASASIGKCSNVISAGGVYNGNIDTKWPFFPAGSNPRPSLNTMFICRRAYGRGDFHAAVDIAIKAGTPVTSPLNGTVINSSYSSCGNGMVDVKVTIPGTNEVAVMQYTHLTSNKIANGSNVVANQTIIGYISTGADDECSSGPHLDFKVYNYLSKRYYNPSIFISGILNNSTSIPVSSFIRGYNGGSGPSGYDKCCDANIGNLPKC